MPAGPTAATAELPQAAMPKEDMELKATAQPLVLASQTCHAFLFSAYKEFLFTCRVFP